MLNRIRKKIIQIQIGLLHATYHRNMRNMEISRHEENIIAFKKYAYRAEDAWRKIVILTEKMKQYG